MSTTLTSREFNQDASRAKRAAAHGPVFVTDRGRLSLVVLSAEDYGRWTESGPTIGELLSSPETADIDIEFPRFKDLPREVDLD